MASVSYPNPGHTDLDEGEYELLTTDGFMPTGLVGVPSMADLVYVDGSGLNVKFRANRSAIIRGQRWATDDDGVTVAIGSNSGATRYDLITLRLDRDAADENVIEYVIGGASGSGVPPPVLDAPGSGVWDYPVASLKIAHGATSFDGSELTPLGYYLGEPILLCTTGTRPPHRFGRRIKVWPSGNEYTSTGVGGKWVLDTEDTNWITLPTISGSGWAATIQLRRRNGEVFTKIGAVTRSGGKLGVDPVDATKTTPAVLASYPVSQIAAFPAGFRPKTDPVGWGGYHGGAHLVQGYVYPSGAFSLTGYYGNAFSTGESFNGFDFSFLAEA